MRVLVVAAPPGGGGGPVVPLGALYLAAAATRAGHEVEVLDLGFSRRPAEDLAAGARRAAPDVIALSLRNAGETGALAGVYGLYRRLVAAAAAAGGTASPTPVVLGGAAFSLFPAALLGYTGADYGIRGEGEAALVELMEEMRASRAGDGGRGLTPRLRRGERPVTLDGGLDDAARARHWRAYGRYYALARVPAPVQAGRGCGGSCAYCSYPLIEGRVQRRRSVEDVAGELARVSALPGVKEAFLVDAALNADPAYAADLAGAVARAAGGGRGEAAPSRVAPWQCCLNPGGLDADLARALRRGGCAGCDLGADALADGPLDGLGKGYRAVDAMRAAQALETAAIPYRLCLILGGPGETAATVAETVRRAGGLKPAGVQAFIGVRLYPEAPLARRLARGAAPGAAGAAPDGARLMWPDAGAFFIAAAARDALRGLVRSGPPGWTFANAALIGGREVDEQGGCGDEALHCH